MLSSIIKKINEDQNIGVPANINIRSFGDLLKRSGKIVKNQSTGCSRRR